LSLQGDAVRALHLAGAAATLRETLGAPLSPAEQGQLDAVLQPSRAALGDASAKAAWAAGCALTLEQAVAIVVH
jgi:hypothetical protein